jgi:hypothetical protein
MNPLVELWVASALGAALFFAAGYSSCLVLRRAEQLVTDSRVAHLRAEIEHVQLVYAAQGHEIDHLDHRAMRAEQSAAELSDALSQARAECLRLDKELRRHSHSTGRAAALEHENAQLVAQVRARALSSTEAEVMELREKLERAEARAREVSAELREQKSADRSPAVQRQLAELRQRIAETAKARAHWESRARSMETTSVSQGAVEAANSALTLEVQRLERTARDRAARIRSLSERVQELERSASENAVLQKQRDSLTVPSEREVKHSGIAPRMWAQDETLGAMLSSQVSLLASLEPGATAVLSDEQGFPLVGTGSDEDQEAVSALTALSQELAGRARSLVGLGRVELMEMVDSGGRALRVRFFDWDDQPLALGYLGRPHLAESEGEARMVSTFPMRRAARSA